jgi:hypothetical protein
MTRRPLLFMLMLAPAVAAAAEVRPDYEKLRKEHWAWQAVKVAPPPPTKDAAWPATDIDRFVLAKLEAAGLKPVRQADKPALIRRVTFDLVGLPPTPAELDAFLADASPDAFAKVVDRLLASPQFGEKWGRHWLDVARYAESTGMTRNFPYPQAWRYRDWVIDAVNADKPYDRFLTEQVAGDLLPASTPQQRNELLVATGFLALGPKDLNERDRNKFVMDNVDEQIDVVGRAVLGLTVSCARCHDHKFDPIPTQDYYSLAGIFRSTDILTGLQSRQGGNNYFDPRLILRLDGDFAPPPDAQAEHQRHLRQLAQRVERVRAELKDLGGDERPGKAAAGLAPVANKQDDNRRFLLRQKQRQLQQLEAELRSTEAAGPGGGNAAVGVSDGRVADCKVHVRGETDKLGPEVPRGFITLIQLPQAPTVDRSHSGRTELAQWLTSRDNPLTARVMANRVWMHLFGQGIVRTVDNFGATGEKPSHPELLDYLAAQFVKDGWSLKKLVRSLVLTRTYQLAATYDAACGEVDPSDRLLWRIAPRRLEAEQIRDAMLAVGGNLDLARPLGSPVMNLPYNEVRMAQGIMPPPNPKRPDRPNRPNRPRPPDVAGVGNHRSIYLPVLRSLVPPALDVFDFAEPSLCTGSRDVTTVATQALYLMNNPFVMDQSRRLAERVQADLSLDDGGRVDLAYRVALSRKPTDAERSQAIEFVRSQGGREPWASFCHVLLASAEFRYLN